MATFDTTRPAPADPAPPPPPIQPKASTDLNSFDPLPTPAVPDTAFSTGGKTFGANGGAFDFDDVVLDDAPAFPADATSPLNAPTVVAQRPNAFMDVIAPDAVVFGETHGDIPGTGGRLAGGNFGLVSLEDGSRTYFGAKPIPGSGFSWGPVSFKASVVGTNGPNGDEAGIGLAGKVPTPAGDVLVFINGRQDVATVGNTLDTVLENPTPGTQTVSINLGAAYSVSDGSLRALATANPALGAVAGVAADLSGSDAWFGAAWRGTATFENGELQSINVSGQEIQADQLTDFLTNTVRRQREVTPHERWLP